jgi:hypothetical protein
VVRIGDKIGNYQVIRSLGSGAMGAVYEGVHEHIQSHVAIKVLHANYAQSEDIRRRFFQEAYTANRVNHAGVVSVFDHGEADEVAYLIMELLSGESLQARVRRGGKLIDRPAALRLMRQLASVCEAAHQKSIVHRDLKPENVMVVADPFTFGGERVKVLDFGIAKLLDQVREPGQAAKQSVGLFGTPMFMAPEAWEGAQAVDAAADIYSLGVILFEVFTGRSPFEDAGDNIARWQEIHRTVVPPALRTLDGSIPEALSDLTARMLHKDRQQRPTAATVARELEQLVGANLRFRAGGFVRDGEFYVRRAADEELFAALQGQKDCQVLGARQSGKTSLRVRTEHRLAMLRDPLRKQGVLCATLDLLALCRDGLRPDGFYFEVLRSLHRGLQLAGFPGDFWQEHADKPPAQRFTTFLTALPGQLTQPAVIFLDHVEALRRLPGAAGELYLALRALQEKSAQATPAGCVNFCLLGLLPLEELVPPREGKLSGRQHVLITQSITLADLSRPEADALLPGLHALGEASRSVLSQVYSWTAGHPYFAQRLCEHLASRPLADGSVQNLVEAAVQDVLVAHQRGEEAALLHADRLLSRSDADSISARRLYGRLLGGQTVAADPEDPAQRVLNDSGAACVREGQLQVRNLIFKRALDAAWLGERDSVRPIAAPLLAWQEHNQGERYLLSGVALQAVLAWADGRTDLSVPEQRLIAASLRHERAGQTRKIVYLSSGFAVLLALLGVSGFSLYNAQVANRKVQAKQVELINAIAAANLARNEAIAARNEIDVARKKTQQALDAAAGALRAQVRAMHAQEKAQSVAVAQRGVAAEAKRQALEALTAADIAAAEAQTANVKADRAAWQVEQTVQSAAAQQQQLRERLASCDARGAQLDQKIQELTQRLGTLQQQLAAGAPATPTREPGREAAPEAAPRPAPPPTADKEPASEAAGAAPAAKEPPREGPKEPARDPAPSKEPARDPAKEPPHDPAKDAPKEPARDPAKDPAKDPAHEPAKDREPAPSRQVVGPPTAAPPAPTAVQDLIYL